MSDTKNITNKQKNILIFLYTVVYIVTSLAGVDSISSALGITVLFSACIYVFRILSLSLIFLAGTKRMLGVAIFPALALCIFEFISGTLPGAINTTIGCASVVCVSLILSAGYRKGLRKSELCSVGGAAALLFELLSVTVSIAISAHSMSVKFSTLLFETIDEIINGYITAYNEILLNMAEISPELYTQAPEIDTELLYSSFILVIALLPAILYCAYFAIMFICTSFMNLSNKKYGFTEKSFGRYYVSGITYGLFTLFGILLVLSLLMDSELSGFTIGVLSVVIAILPHFVIFAYKRIYAICVHLCGKGGAILLITLVSGALCIFAFQIFLCVLAMFGTAQYRMEKYQQRLKK